MNFLAPDASRVPDAPDVAAVDVELGELDFSPLPIANDALSPLRALVAHLRGCAAGRARLGYLSHAPQSDEDWREMAARAACEVAFLPQIWLDALPNGARFASIDVPKLLKALDEIAGSSGTSDVVLIAGLDLMLTRLDPDECARFWDDLHPRLPHRPRALILGLPHGFARFGPDAGAWEKISARLE